VERATLGGMAERSYRLTVEGDSAKTGQILAVFEMLTGQVFLVTLVAGLVSLWRLAALLGEQLGG
jgi:hypothetical protein